MSFRDRPPFRADHVGSFLRPNELLDMRQQVEEGREKVENLRSLEDRCIADLVEFQESLGLKSITDGEFRRGTFHGDFISQMDGVQFKQLFAPGETEAGGHEAPFVAVVDGRVARPAGGIEVENFRYLKGLTAETAKQTIPSPTMMHFRGGREAVSEDVYPEMGEFFADLERAYSEEVVALGDAGCRYLQIDDTNLAYLCDPKMREQATERGENVDELPLQYAGLINRSIAGRPDDMGVCVHLCRGNAKSRWFAEGGYEPVAEVMFNEMDVDGFLLEFDDERSGGMEPLRYLPADKTVVLGLVSTKWPELESRDAIIRRIEEAAGYCSIDQLCLSPQCGFASVSDGNEINVDVEKRKLDLIVDVAQEVWA